MLPKPRNPSTRNPKENTENHRSRLVHPCGVGRGAMAAAEEGGRFSPFYIQMSLAGIWVWMVGGGVGF